jgi:hypothetical protein
MTPKPIHECQCLDCQSPADHSNKQIHHHMNLLMSRLDEQQRRWYAAVEAEKIGHGGNVQIAQITGMNVETIRRGREELAQDLAERPADRIRLPGGGRPRVEKKNRE